MTKQEQRASALAARDALTDAERREYSKAICSRLMRCPELDGARVVLLYRAFGHEASLSALDEALTARGVAAAYPVCGRDGSMEAYIPLAPEGWSVNSLGISEPIPESSRWAAPEDIDVVVAPGVAFDAQRNRIGWGAGYYDRYFLRCPGAARLCAAFEAQRVERICAQEHDVPLEAVVTEKRRY